MKSALLLLLGVLAAIFTLSVPLGLYMSVVFDGTLARRFALVRRTEALFLAPLGSEARVRMDWIHYCLALVALAVVSTVAAYAVLRLQGLLPLNPLSREGLSPDLAFNTAVSFSTSTTWQAYSGESALSILSQVFLTILSFVSSASGLVVAFAFARGLVQSRGSDLGNAWVDITRCVLWLLLPLSILVALFFISQGSVQTLGPSVVVETLDGGVQSIALGPVASQEALRLVSVTGGSFFSANSAHPFATPNAVVCLLQIVLMLIVASSLVFAYGRMTGNVREGFSILFGMAVLFAAAFFLIAWSEGDANTLVTAEGVTEGFGNMEGKEVRFGTTLSSLFAATAAASSAGSAACSFDSMLPLAGGISMWLIQAGDVIFGGARSGLYTMLGLAILAVFIFSMLVGRTPRYIGKTIDVYDLKMVCVALLTPSVCTMIGTAAACVVEAGYGAVPEAGPHGFTEILFAFSSVSNNNGAAFGGLAADSPFYNTALGACMWISRNFTMTALLAVAGNMAGKPRMKDVNFGLRTDGPVFSFRFILAAALISSVTFFPAHALGPVVEAVRYLAR